MSEKSPVLTDAEESAAQGLILLGRSREEAIKEIRRNEDEQFKQMERDWWGNS
jgi:hypothetical protein